LHVSFINVSNRWTSKGAKEMPKSFTTDNEAMLDDLDLSGETIVEDEPLIADLDIEPAPVLIERQPPKLALVPSSTPIALSERDKFYHDLPADMADELRATATRINSRMRTAVIDIGNDLLKIRGKLAGRFDRWIKLEFNMSKSSAWNYINTVEQFGSTPEVIEALPSGTVYKLAAKATPAEVREAVVQEISRGADVSVADVEQRIASAKAAEKKRKEEERERADAERLKQEEEKRWQVKVKELKDAGKSEDEIENERKALENKKVRRERDRQRREEEARLAREKSKAEISAKAKAAEAAAKFLRERLGSDFEIFTSMMDGLNFYDVARAVAAEIRAARHAEFVASDDLALADMIDDDTILLEEAA
jgi:hypothetical protein